MTKFRRHSVAYKYDKMMELFSQEALFSAFNQTKILNIYYEWIDNGLKMVNYKLPIRLINIVIFLSY